MIVIPQWELILIHWIQYISEAMYVGMLFFYLCILPKGSLQSASIEKHYRRLFNLSFILLFICILLNYPLEAERSGAEAWVFQLIVTLILYFLSFRVFYRRNNLYFWTAFILGITLLIVKTSASHAATGENTNLLMILDCLQLVAGSIWIGSLIAIAALLPLRKREEGKVFFKGIIHLFLPWGAFFMLILVVINMLKGT